MQSNTERISRYHLLIQSDHVGSYIVQLVLSMLLLMISTVNCETSFTFLCLSNCHLLQGDCHELQHKQVHRGSHCRKPPEKKAKAEK